MREIPGVEQRLLERLYLLASAKAQIVAAEAMLQQAHETMNVLSHQPRSEHLAIVCSEAGVALMKLREKVFRMMEDEPR